VQFSFYILATLHCAEVVRYRRGLFAVGKATSVPPQPFCEILPDKLQNSADQGLAVLLALLGGGTLAASEIQRRRSQSGNKENDDMEP
jgi:hypothetical protein